MSSDSSQYSRRQNEYIQEHWQDLTLAIKETEEEQEEEEESMGAINVNIKDLVELRDSPFEYNNLEQFDKMFIDLPWNTNVNTKEETQNMNSIEDPILPQKISSLSSAHTTNNKKSLLKDIQAADIDQIPNYLTKRNKSFQQIIHHVQSTITTTVTVTANKTNHGVELRKIAILIYKIMVIQTYHLLWIAYLRSGLGELIIPSKEQLLYSTTIPIWPKEIKTLLQLTKKTNKDDDEIYLNFVNDHLHELDHQLKQYQTELNIKANNFNGYTLAIQKILETYIEQNLQSFRMKIEHQIELIHYDYHIRALKLEFFRYKPNADQEQLMKQLCQSKYEHEITEQEYHLLKQQINYYNSPSQSFECSPIAQSTLIASIQNADIRQQLFNQYKEIPVQSRVAFFNLNLETAEEQREGYQKKYEDNVKKMWSNYYSLDENQKMSWIMIQLINQRCHKIGERIKYIYKFKAQSTLS